MGAKAVGMILYDRELGCRDKIVASIIADQADAAGITEDLRYDDIMKYTGMSRSSVKRAVTDLRAKGRIHTARPAAFGEDQTGLVFFTPAGADLERLADRAESSTDRYAEDIGRIIWEVFGETAESLRGQIDPSGALRVQSDPAVAIAGSKLSTPSTLESQNSSRLRSPVDARHTPSAYTCREPVNACSTSPADAGLAPAGAGAGATSGSNGHANVNGKPKEQSSFADLAGEKGVPASWSKLAVGHSNGGPPKSSPKKAKPNGRPRVDEDSFEHSEDSVGPVLEALESAWPGVNLRSKAGRPLAWVDAVIDGLAELVPGSREGQADLVKAWSRSEVRGFCHKHRATGDSIATFVSRPDGRSTLAKINGSASSPGGSNGRDWFGGREVNKGLEHILETALAEEAARQAQETRSEAS